MIKILRHPSFRRLFMAHELDRYLQAATRDNTRKSYQSALRHLEVAWGGYLPATPDSVSRYLVHYATELAANTLRQRLAGSTPRYGGIYVATALAWLVLVDEGRLDRIDLFGGGLIFLGALVMVVGHWRS